MFQVEEHESSKVYTGKYMQFSLVKAQSIRKEVVGREVGEIREVWL